MTTFSVYRRVEDLVDLLIPDTFDSTGAELAHSYTINSALNWDGVFAPVPDLSAVVRGYGRTTLSVTNTEKDIAGGSAVLKGKTRILAHYSDLGWNDSNVIFLTVTAHFPTLPDETGPILMVLTPNQYRLQNGSLILSGVAAGPITIQLPRTCFDAVIVVTAGTVLAQFGVGPGAITVVAPNIYVHPRAQFSTITLDGGGTCSVSLTLNVSR